MELRERVVSTESGETWRPETGRKSIKRHVLGVAFPYAEIGAFHEQHLERYFLQLAYAACRLSSSGESVRGYFAVLRQETRDAVRRLRVRYEVVDSIYIVFTSLLVSDMTRLADAAEVAESEGDQSIVTSVGRDIATDALRREIALQEPEVVERSSIEPMPFGVRWDFWGVVYQDETAQSEEHGLCPRLL